MRFQKWHSLALAVLVLLLLSPLVMAQPNPPVTADDQADAAAAGVFGAGCLGVICVVGLVILGINIAMSRRLPVVWG